MAGIAGIFQRGGSPPTLASLHRITEAAAERGPDGPSYWIDGPVGLAHLACVTTPEAALDGVRPVRAEALGLTVTLDGRIDNREELLETLDLQRDEVSDERLLLAAYAAWGPDCAARLIGDFAYAIWDAPQQRLVCSRDCFGIAPFCYFVSAGIFVFGSELRQLLAHGDIPARPNERVVAEHLSNDIRSIDETLYRGLMRLPPAHTLVVTREEQRLWRYWSPDPRREIRYRDPADYAAHFRELFREAVRCRVRCTAKVGAYLSGGLDSSSVVCMTEQLLRDHAVQDVGFETFSLVFPGQACDESPFINDVIARWGSPAHRICPDDDGGRCYHADYAGMARQFRDLPNYPNGCTANPIKETALRRGFKVLLTGFGGDDWLTGSLRHWGDSMRQGRPLELARQIWFDRRVPWADVSARRVLTEALGAMCGERGLVAARRIKRRVTGAGPTLSVLTSAFASAAAASAPTEKDELNWPSLAQADLWNYSMGGYQLHVLEVEDRFTASLGLEQRHPLSDRRLVEFALSIPEEQRWHRDLPKYVLRRGMRGLLPESVRCRRTKASFDHPAPRVLAAPPARDVFADLRVVREGWVDGPRVDALYRGLLDDAACGDAARHSNSFAVWEIYAVELWLRALVCGPSV